ncbi:m7GpppN-mRNA hydrolase [Hyalella azteca]|uniref:mRNA-decapping enzyme 2 n=1 Tax=Hyalella azteca TaxID=294128 RepID=A0A8B7PCL3_HYAAZ|nr:m7GpppN-mRNA hydrolase [Hyalella azteca]
MGNRYDDRFRIPIHIITDCISRFLMEEVDRVFEDRIHYCTYLEQAYWFYKDCWLDEQPETLKLVSFAGFIDQVNQALACKWPGGGTAQQLVGEFTDFKHHVSTYGAILVDPSLSKVLLVQGFNGQSWGFPKGKIEENEATVECAVREVREEINYDISPFINPDLYLQMTILEQQTRLYIIYGVPTETKFKTNTRKEIGNIKWFELSSLPAHKGDKRPLANTSYSPNNFFVIIPFVKHLRESVSLMQRRCLETFGVPMYKQIEFHFEFLKKYYPKIYEIRMEQKIQSKQEAERKKREKMWKKRAEELHGDAALDYSEKTLKQQLKEQRKLAAQQAHLQDASGQRIGKQSAQQSSQQSSQAQQSSQQLSQQSSQKSSQQSSQQSSSDILTLLQNATLRVEQEKQGPATKDVARHTEHKKFRFKSLLKRQSSPSDINTSDASHRVAENTLQSTETSHQATKNAPTLPGASNPTLNKTAFGAVSIERSKTWDDARLDFQDIMNAVEATWRANISTATAPIQKKSKGKENKFH